MINQKMMKLFLIKDRGNGVERIQQGAAVL